MADFRWLVAMALVGSLGCSADDSSVPDGGASGQDSSRPDDAAPSPDAPAILEGSTPDVGSAEAGPAEAGPSSDGGCVTASVNFDLRPGVGAPPYCLGAPGSCSSDWFGVRPAHGTSLGLEANCRTQCSDCQPVACSNLCAAAVRLGDGGAQTSWEGTYFAPSTCGVATSCLNQACAPPGNYIATFCGYAANADASTFDCVGSSTPTCTDIPFVWPPAPGSPFVQGFLGGPPPDAGDGG